MSTLIAVKSLFKNWIITQIEFKMIYVLQSQDLILIYRL